MGFIGDYFSWAGHHDHNSWLPELVLFVLMPALVLFVALTGLVWILAGTKDAGQAFGKGVRRGMARKRSHNGPS